MRQYRCRSCDQLHDGLPTAYGAEAPAYWYGLSSPEREERFQLSSDTAIFDDQHFFVLGRVEIPIIGEEEPFVWGAWITLGQEDFERALEHWETPGRERLLEPTVGFLSSSLPTYPDTLNLLGRLHTRPLGLRPFIELEPTDHPLAVEQRTGITWARVEEIASVVLHGAQHGA